MYILSFNGDFNRVSHDVSAYLFKNGKLLYACEEERYNGIRYSEGKIPESSIRFCLNKQKITMRDIDFIRNSNQEILQEHMNIAASVQKRLENAMVSFISYYLKHEEITEVCLAGGTFMNGFLNGKILNIPKISELYVSPTCDDSGTAMGAAMLLAVQNGYSITAIRDMYYGDDYSDEEIVKELRECNVHFTDYNQGIYKHVACKLSQNKIIGWFQGKMELGSRALGNRSILANPKSRRMKIYLNNLKGRFDFQSISASVMDEDKNKYFEIPKKCSDNFMAITFDVKKEVMDLIPAAVHIDGTARIQTVTEDSNKMFYTLLMEFKEITGCSVLLNTSLKKSGHPISRTVKDALALFYASGLDGLAIGTCYIHKND